ncbi:MAG: T9SS type A sorting domain-containing protein [Saprospiraceae bacterium]|nr:T9SS type A sorting domain-containing protein [Saprospiraceae bacterium]
MKVYFLHTLALFLFIGLILQSASSGRAANGEMDATGSPLGQGDCGNGYCHGAGGGNATFTNPTVSVQIKDISGTVITSYIPDSVYTFELTVTSGGSPAGFGVQSVVLDSLNNRAGDLISVTTPNTQISTVSSGVQYLEQNSISTSGFFSGTWKAPSSGTGNVMVYARGLAVNNSGNYTGDQATPSVQIILAESTLTSIEKVNSVEATFEIFPIPNDGTFYIANKGMSEDISIRIFDMLGIEVYSESVFIEKANQHRIHVHGLLKGVYSVQIKRFDSLESKLIQIK